jgi:outer membrane cobalamin receptor
MTRAAAALLAVVLLQAHALAQDDADVPIAAGDEVIAEEEVIEVWGERPNKPFDRDTELRLTGDELIERGVTDLADALDFVPELHVRELGRGGVQADIRGARKGAVKILIDGIPVDEPYYGTFDLSSIPVTDIEQIRVSMSPSSPIDGAGGPGGVIEVHTRDAVGGRMLRARGQGSGLNAADVSATTRASLGAGWAVRGSASGTFSARDYDVTMPDGSQRSLDEDRRAAIGALRFEWRRHEVARVVIDASAQHRSFVPPPGDDGSLDVLVIDGETTARLGAAADLDRDGYRLHGRAYTQILDRDSTYFADATLSDEQRGEHITGNRSGAALLLNRPHTRTLHVVAAATVDTEAADVEDSGGAVTGSGRSTVVELAAGAQYQDGPFRVDAAGGLAAPIGVGEDPWPEAKLTLAYTPATPLTIEAIGARKGRVPTLRERYRTDIGNDELDPEIANFGEVAAEMRPAKWLTARVGSFIRDTDGMIRFDGDRMELVNVDDLTVRGFDAVVTATPGRINGGASWSFQDAFSPRFGTDALDFLPQHRASVWLGGAVVAGAGVRARVRYEGSQLDRGATLAAHSTLDLSAYARIGHLFGTIRLDNATGERYEQRGGVAAPGRVLALSLQGDWD